ncbi:MAG: hypothetical protein OEZ10_00780 [Gammaproteobacteria bacterium]|nr:hypothetical protein [Gammaproteobacteria bacterium]
MKFKFAESFSVVKGIVSSIVGLTAPFWLSYIYYKFHNTYFLLITIYLVILFLVLAIFLAADWSCLRHRKVCNEKEWRDAVALYVVVYLIFGYTVVYTISGYSILDVFDRDVSKHVVASDIPLQKVDPKYICGGFSKSTVALILKTINGDKPRVAAFDFSFNNVYTPRKRNKKEESTWQRTLRYYRIRLSGLNRWREQYSKNGTMAVRDHWIPEPPVEPRLENFNLTIRPILEIYSLALTGSEKGVNNEALHQDLIRIGGAENLSGFLREYCQAQEILSLPVFLDTEGLIKSL